MKKYESEEIKKAEINRKLIQSMIDDGWKAFTTEEGILCFKEPNEQDTNKDETKGIKRLKRLERIKEIILLMLLCLIVVYGWQGLEVLFYGEIQPRTIDNIIATILIWSIYLNVKKNK